MHSALSTLNLHKLFIVYPDSGGLFPINEKIEAIAVQDLEKPLVRVSP